MTIVEFSVPTLQSLTSTCNAVVVFCTGLALLSAKSSMQVTTIGISSVTFCFQRLLFMIIIDVRVPQLSCDVFATISYVLQVAMRLSVIAGLYFRASAANRQLKLMLLDIAIDFSAFAGLLSVSLLVFMGSTTPFIAPEYCLQDMNHLQVLLNNILFVFSAASLTYLMAYPISKTLAISATKHAQQILARYGGRINPAAIPQSKTYTQARVMLKVVRFVPTFLLAVLLIVLLGSDLTNRTLLFLGSLIITDFAGVVLLLFPIIVMSGDNGDGVAGRVKFPKLKNRHASMGSRSVLGSPIEDGTELKSENAVTNLDTLGRQDSVVVKLRRLASLDKAETGQTFVDERDHCTAGVLGSHSRSTTIGDISMMSPAFNQADPETISPSIVYVGDGPCADGDDRGDGITALESAVIVDGALAESTALTIASPMRMQYENAFGWNQDGYLEEDVAAKTIADAFDWSPNYNSFPM